jgi:hypothetical protein
VHDGSYVVVDGGRQLGALVVTGGDVRLAPGSRTDGPVLLLGGTLTIDGLVTGDVLAPSGDLVLGPFAALRGALGVGGGFERHPDALVVGEITTGIGLPADVAAGGTGGAWRVLVQALAAALWAAAWARWAPRRLRTMGGRPPATPRGAGAGGARVRDRPGRGRDHGVHDRADPGQPAAARRRSSRGGHRLGGPGPRRSPSRLERGPLRGHGHTVRLAAVGGFAVALALGAIERVPWVGGAVALGVGVTALGAVALTGLGGRPFVHAAEAELADRAT